MFNYICQMSDTAYRYFIHSDKSSKIGFPIPIVRIFPRITVQTNYTTLERALVPHMLLQGKDASLSPTK